jgi:hypothetical protein
MQRGPKGSVQSSMIPRGSNGRSKHKSIGRVSRAVQLLTLQAHQRIEALRFCSWTSGPRKARFCSSRWEPPCQPPPTMPLHRRVLRHPLDHARSTACKLQRHQLQPRHTYLRKRRARYSSTFQVPCIAHQLQCAMCSDHVGEKYHHAPLVFSACTGFCKPAFFRLSGASWDAKLFGSRRCQAIWLHCDVASAR